MVKAKKYVVKKYFEGFPKRDDFEIVEFELPELKNGEILVKSEFISVDPSQRITNRMNSPPYDQHSFNVGVIEASKNPNFPVGLRVVSQEGWTTHYIGNPSARVENPSDRIYKLPDLRGLPSSLGLGAVGMPGACAYYGFLDICKPKAGETVVITGAAGAIGSMVGQIAKIKGCKVIGFAGSDEKVEWLEKELGFDKAFNYKKVDVTKALNEAAPEGVDCYYDNVGGEISSLIMRQMNMYGRVSVSGSISVYNEDPAKMAKATIVQLSIVSKQLKVEGFIWWRWADTWDEGFAEIVDWIKTGKLKAREHVTEGFDKVFDAFIGVLNGENFGKAVVKV